MRIVIVGGGTAGWLAALMLSHRFRGASAPVSITVVESSRIPTVGVGEGTTSVFRAVLRQLGLDEAEFLAATGATIKYGIRHRDWRRPGHVYDGPIDDPHAVTGQTGGPLPWLDLTAVAAAEPLARHHLFHWLMQLERAPVARHPQRGTVAVGPFDHAFHFDQARVGAWLRDQAIEVERRDLTVLDVARDAGGDITHLVCEHDERVAGDFFIDCTGFRRQIVGGAMGSEWCSYREALPVNRAMPFWLPHEAGQGISPFTVAHAQRAGWMWRIPTQERIGCGYVYDDTQLTPDQAQAEIEGVLGHSIEPRADLRFDSGRLDLAWRGNAVALGLACNFLEPLEATSIHATVVQLMLLTTRHLQIRPDSDAASRSADRVRFIDSAGYNATVAGQVDDFRDFINLHYVSERSDSPFWQERVPACITVRNRERVARWQRAMPRRDEFPSLIGGLPHTDSQLYYPVLDGLGILTSAAAKAALAEVPVARTAARKTRAALQREYRQAAARALNHRDWLIGGTGGQTSASD